VKKYETQAPTGAADDARQHAAMRKFGGLALMKPANELAHGAGAVAGRFEPDKRDSGVEAAEYLSGIPADRSNRATEIAGIS